MEERRAEGLDGSPWLLPAPSDGAQPVTRTRLHNWIRATKFKHRIDVPRLGYHSEKRAGIRDSRFRALPAKAQEELAGTTWEMMRRVYDHVDLPALKDAGQARARQASPYGGVRGSACGT